MSQQPHAQQQNDLQQALPQTAAQRALAEAAARRALQAAATQPKELQGRDVPDPVRYGDWEVNGRAVDF